MRPVSQRFLNGQLFECSELAVQLLDLQVVQGHSWAFCTNSAGAAFPRLIRSLFLCGRANFARLVSCLCAAQKAHEDDPP